MPRLTPCRLLKLLTLPWIVMIGMWFFLPSPTPLLDKQADYIQDRIASGRTVITAVNYAALRRDAGPTNSFICYECSDVLFHWRVVKSGPNYSLRVSDSDEYSTIDLTDLLRNATELNVGNKDLDADGDLKPRIYYSAPIVLDGIPAGDTDEEINMPWFQPTDKKLIHYNMHNNRVSVIVVAVVPEPGLVHIHRAAYVEQSLSSPYAEIMAYGLETDYLASFGFRDDQETIVVGHLSGSLSSWTYPIRRALLIPLGPFIAIPFILFAELSEVISPFLYLVVVCLVLLVGFVSYRRMLRGGSISSLFGGLCWPIQFMRRRQRKNNNRQAHVWGPTGPVDMKKSLHRIDEEKEIDLQRPETVRLGKSWKG
jgi:hypothetical protein